MTSDSTHWRSVMVTWLVGAVVGTLLIACTSPLFIRSYAPLHADALRQVWTLPPATTYRWRSEGYADTHVGPHGMPGRQTLDSSTQNAVRVALWGDSQAEGVCVADPDKLFAQSESIAAGKVAVLPLARSGEDAAAWVTQIPRVEQSLQIDAHVLLIVELSDLVAATGAPVAPPSDSDVAAAHAAIAGRLPAFIIQAARHLLTEPDETTRRELRFGIGPIVSRPDEGVQITFAPPYDWQPTLAILRQSTQRPIVILYAPKVPQIVAGNIVRTDSMATSFDAMTSVAQTLGIHVVDARPDLLAAAERGEWPHGFHNGQIGVGHLNATGYALLASRLVDAVQDVVE